MINVNQNAIQFYEEEALVYDDRRWNTLSGRYNDKVQKEIVLELVGNCKDKLALDIATGTGRFALELALNGAKIIAVDSSKGMLQVTNNQFKKAKLRKMLEIKKGVATKLPVATKSIDICICINAMNHIEKYLNALYEIKRVLKPGGFAVISYTNWISPYFPFGVWVNIRKKSIFKNVYTKWFNSIEIFSLYKTSDLVIEDVRGELHFPTWGNNKGLLFFLKAFDRMLRNPPLGYFASQLFVKAYKN